MKSYTEPSCCVGEAIREAAPIIYPQHLEDIESKVKNDNSRICQRLADMIKNRYIYDTIETTDYYENDFLGELESAGYRYEFITDENPQAYAPHLLCGTLIIHVRKSINDLHEIKCCAGAIR